MPSERVQRQIDLLLDEAEKAIAASDWPRVRDRARNALALNPEDADALSYVAAADRAGAEAIPGPSTAPLAGVPTMQPTSFANGRYTVTRFLGEGGKKKTRKASRVESYNTYIYKVLKQVHPGEFGVNRGAVARLASQCRLQRQRTSDQRLVINRRHLCVPFPALSLQRWASPRRACPS